MSWLTGVTELRRRGVPGVLVTVVQARGHAPRTAGAKMVVSADATWATIGGGNLESVAIERARALLTTDAAHVPTLTTESFELSDKAPLQHGVQCCGGAVTVLLETLPPSPTVAIFGVGHVGLELARILARHDLDLHLVDSRPERLTPAMLAPLADAEAQVHVHALPILPEAALAELPRGAHILVMTHDHAEDAAIVDAALRTEGIGSIGLIGSAGKWARFRARLLAEGGFGEADVDRVTTPIGLADLVGKEPAVIAVSVAADLLLRLQTTHAEG